MHNMEKCGSGKGRPQGCSLRSHRRRRLAPLPPPFSPAPMLRHVVYASLLHFGVETADRKIINLYRMSEACQRLGEVEGIGPITATALVAAAGDGKCFKNGRQFAAWIGLVPKQRSSGGRSRLLGISKRGDRYLRTLLIHGARAALGRTRGKQDPRSLWLLKMRERRHANVVAVALANKNARIA